MKKKHLAFYKKYAATGTIPENGLCQCSGIDLELLKLFRPTKDVEKKLFISDQAYGYWGSGLSIYDNNKYRSFTPLRQTIILFMAAMNKEL